MIRTIGRAHVVIAWVLAAHGAAWADPLPVSLADVLGAVGRAPGAQVSVHEVEAAEALVDAAGAWPSPSLHVATNRLTARVVAGASLPLPVFGTVGAARRQAAAEAEVVRTEGDTALRLLRHRAVLAWIALARADGEVVASSIAAQQAAELALIARGRQDAGVGADVDVTTAGAAKARADVAAAGAVRAQAAASAELAGVLGWPPGQPLRSAGPPATGEPAELAALRARLARHPERVAAVARLAAADAAVAQVAALAWPSVSLEAEVSYDDPTNEDRTDAMVGVALELPVFARIGDRVRAARQTSAAQRARLAATETELGAELAAAFERWRAASDTLAGLERDVVPAQERAAALSAQAYREGARDLASALQAERDLASVRAEVNTARADAAVAWEDLQRAAGTDAP
ncbi:MAG TPA: TolC family protein [Kofleriaceae bacterium]|nr:TolC family protein [Kofleriaceae bacterium]